MATTEPFAHVEQLSLCGLVSRLELVEQLKQSKSPSEEEQLVLASETEAKKAILEQLSAAGNGLSSLDRSKAKDFLSAQIKSVEPGSKNAEARITKLRTLLTEVDSAPKADEPQHARKAQAELAKAEAQYQEVHKNYERWEKGKKMLAVDELNILKRTHEDLMQRVEALKAWRHRQTELRPEAAEPIPTTNKVIRSTVPVSSKATSKASGSVVGGGPAYRPAAKQGAGGGGGGYPAPSAAAMRQAQMVAQFRAEAEPEQEQAPRPARPPPRPKPEEEEKVVLSYVCTVIAVAEVAGVSQDAARAMAPSVSEFKAQFDSETWAKVRERSQAIERERQAKEREAEKRKQAAALERAEAKKAGAPAGKAAAQAPKPKGAPPGVAAAGAKAKAKPKGDPGLQAKVRKQQALLGDIATKNAFGGLGGDSSDDDEGGGWTAIRR